MWVEGQPRLISGITEATNCQDIIFALAHATNRVGKFSLVEKWRTSERSLSPQDQPIKILNKWGEYASDVQFILRCVDGSPEGPIKPPRHYTESNLPESTASHSLDLSFNEGNQPAKPYFISAASPVPESGTLQNKSTNDGGNPHERGATAPLKSSGRETPLFNIGTRPVGLMRSRTEDLKFGSVAASASGMLNLSVTSNNSSSVFGGTDNLSGSFDQSFNSHEYDSYPNAARSNIQQKKPNRPPPSYDVAMRTRRNQVASGFHPHSQRSRSLDDLNRIAKNQEVILIDQSQRLKVFGHGKNISSFLTGKPR